MGKNRKDSETLTQKTVSNAIAKINKLRTVHLYKALHLAEQIAKSHPSLVKVQIILAELRAEIGAYELAQKAYSAALKLDPNSSAVLTSIGRLLADQENLDAARKTLLLAIHKQPEHIEAYQELAEVYFLTGNAIAAREVLLSCLRHDPTNGSVHRRLADAKKYSTEDEHVRTLSALISTISSGDSNEANLHFGYAKAMEDLENFELSFYHYMKGGALQKKIYHYTSKKTNDMFSKIRSTSTALLNLKTKISAEHSQPTPIFITGMPRSGTTLIEQIISSHSEVVPCGELDLLDRAVRNLILNKTAFDADALLRIREGYLSYVTRRSKGAKYITDKMPLNFRHISLISKCLPEAKIVHVSRDPRATCWSNFKHFFPADGLAYTWDIDDTVAYYNMYLDLMDFHREHMVGEMIEIRYEELVANPHVEIPKLIAALGLDWQDACLEPQNNKRAVRTASQMQVQQSIYKGSSDGWRKFEPFLSEAFSKLKGLPPEA